MPLQTELLIYGYTFPHPKAGDDRKIHKSQRSEQVQSVVWSVSKQSEHMRPCCPHPFGRNRDEAVDEFLQPMFGLDVAEDLSDFVQDGGIKVLAHSHKQREHSVLVKERAWQMAPSEIIIQRDEITFSRTTQVVVFNDFLLAHLPVIGQYASFRSSLVLNVYVFPLLAVYMILSVASCLMPRPIVSLLGT